MRSPDLVNRAVLGLLRRRRLGMGRSLIGLAVRGVRSGNVYRLPVQYAKDNDVLLVVPSGASGKTWWRNLRQPSDVSVLIDGAWEPATGEVIASGDARHRPLAEAYTQRWPEVDVADEPIVSIVRAQRPPQPGSLALARAIATRWDGEVE